MGAWFVVLWSFGWLLLVYFPYGSSFGVGWLVYCGCSSLLSSLCSDGLLETIYFHLQVLRCFRYFKCNGLLGLGTCPADVNLVSSIRDVYWRSVECPVNQGLICSLSCGKV